MLDNVDRADELYPQQTYNIMIFESSIDAKRDIAARIRALGGKVDMVHAGKYLIRATLTPDQLFEVARFDDVLFIDRWGPYEKDMDISRELGGANYIESTAGYTGQGVRGESFDAGFNPAHIDFQSRPLIVHNNAGSNDSHGAATSGVCFGDGTGDPTARGLLPDGQGIISYYGGYLGEPARYDHTGELLEPAYEGVFQTSSVGSPRVTQYTTISAETDAALFDFDTLHCQSQSNSGWQDSRPEAWAKNIVSGGGVYHYNTLDTSDDCWCGGASIGPASDGRIKPDLCHFYDDSWTTYVAFGNGYGNFGGTSNATPNICGYTGLFFQMWSEGIFGNEVNPLGTVFENRSHMTTAKAMMINTARQYPFSGTSHDLTRVHQGWGFPDVQYMYDKREQMLIVDETDVLTNLASTQYNVDVPNDEPQFKVTMTYADPAGNPGSSQHRINDLSLKVTSPSGDVYWGNNGLLANNYSTPGGSPNEVDTVENVFIETPEAGSWLIEVIAHEINEDGHVETPGLDADYALVVSGAARGPGFALSPDPVMLEICAPDDAVYTIDVLQFSEFDESVELSASGAPAGTTVNFSENPVTPPAVVTMTVSGTENAAAGDYQIEVTGIAPSMERSTFVALDLSTDLPGDVMLMSPADGETEVARQPTLAWQAASQANVYDLQLATDAGFGNVIYEVSQAETSHELEIMLDSLTTYYWHVRASNGCGITDWSEAFEFTTLEQPDYFTEEFGDDFDLAGFTVEFRPDGTGDYYDLCGYESDELPTDPAGGTTIPLSDDDSESVNPGTPVELYGTSYNTFYVGSNGFITFTGGDSDYTESLEEHFEQPRISGLWDDLNPSTGGTVSYKVLEDRVAVTWLAVPEYFNTGANTFQIEMFFEGTIRITWTSITAGDGIICGLSNGGGVPFDYLETNLSAAQECTEPCPADVTGDLVVNVNDLLFLLDAWGDPGGPADLNEDGIVNILDLLLMLDAWGGC
jgi:serine protease AprX